MKDCWQKEPEKRLEFTKITMRLKYPYHNYDAPPGSDLTEEAEEPKDKEAAKPGNDRELWRRVFLSEDSRGIAHFRRLPVFPHCGPGSILDCDSFGLHFCSFSTSSEGFSPGVPLFLFSEKRKSFSNSNLTRPDWVRTVMKSSQGWCGVWKLRRRPL